MTKTTAEILSEAESLAFALPRVVPDDCGNDVACAGAAEMIRALLSMQDEAAAGIAALEAERDKLREAGDRLSFCARASNGSARRDRDLVNAISGWADALAKTEGE